MKRLLSSLAQVVLVVLFGVAFAYSQTKEPLEVGAFLPITGKFALPGELQRNGILSATDDINAAGGINGRSVRVVIEDSSDSNTTAVTAMRKLAESKYPVVFGPVLGTQMLAAMPVIAEVKVPVVTISGTRKVTQQDNPWVFRISTHDGYSKPALVKYAAEVLKVKRAAILHESDEYGHSGRVLFLEAMKTYGIEPTVVVSVDAGEKDLSAHLLRIKNSKAEALFEQLHDNIFALTFRQAKRLGLAIPQLASASAGNVTMPQLLSAQELAGVYFEGFFSPTDSRPEVQKWIARYKAKSGNVPDGYVALAYDQAMVAYKAMQRYGVEREAVQRGLREIEYPGITGQLRADREQSMGHEILIFQWGNDKTFKPVERIKLPFEAFK
jgi:branched-chain amino acid transport system substrate-binding protein